MLVTYQTKDSEDRNVIMKKKEQGVENIRININLDVAKKKICKRR